MFAKKSTEGYRPVIDNIKMKALVYGEKTLLSEFKLQKDAVLPCHSHPHEQTGYLISGRMQLTIGTETFDVTPGDSWCIASNIEHSGLALNDSIAIEVFSPRREDYLP